jgi:hypothetical protein
MIGQSLFACCLPLQDAPKQIWIAGCRLRLAFQIATVAIIDDSITVGKALDGGLACFICVTSRVLPCYQWHYAQVEWLRICAAILSRDGD